MQSALPATEASTRHHLRLRPGTPVMLREPGVLQLGLDEPVLRLPDAPATRQLLGRLGQAGGVRPDVSSTDPLLSRIDAAGLLVVVPDDEPTTAPTPELLRAQFGRDAHRRRRVRAQARVAIHASADDADALGALFDAAGLASTPPADLDASAHLVVVRGPVDRELLDPLVHGSVPHLVVSGGATRRRIGPFVEPGRTACQRCVDAHEALHDARLPLLVCQAARAAAEHPPPADPLLDAVAFAWAVRDLCRYVEGDEPSTWSATVDLDPQHPVDQVRWGRHPECGCAWDVIDFT